VSSAASPHNFPGVATLSVATECVQSGDGRMPFAERGNVDHLGARDRSNPGWSALGLDGCHNE